MTGPDASPLPGSSSAGPTRGDGLSRLFIGILAVEVIVIAGLYWLGRYFG